MTNDEIVLTGTYSSQLTKKVDTIAKKTAKRKRCRLIVLPIAILICVAALLWGMSNHNTSLEEQYSTYSQTKDRLMLDVRLFDYRDTKEIFERSSLGNTIIQSHMNGYFYKDDSISIFPDSDSGTTKITVSDQTKILCAAYASHINVFENVVYYKDTGTMTIKKYDIFTENTADISLGNVGQFVVCDGMMIYTDVSNGELMIASDESVAESIAQEVISFSVVGNDILYLKKDKALHRISLSTKKDTIVGKNINSYVFDGKLWIQNGTSILTQKISDSTFAQLDVAVECHRILGITDQYLLVDSDIGICAIHNETYQVQRLDGTLIFVAASDDGTLLVYNSAENRYSIVLVG